VDAFYRYLPPNYVLGKYLKRLLGIGRTVIQDALQRLDMLTREETAMAVARNLEMVHEIRRELFLMPLPSITEDELRSQRTSHASNFEHGSLLRILPEIITLRARCGTMGLQHGLSKAVDSKNGR
jgi:hypothetical protein